MVLMCYVDVLCYRVYLCKRPPSPEYTVLMCYTDMLCYRVYLCKQWQELKVFNDHTALATGVRFGHNATFLASASMDRSLKVFGMA